MVLVSFYYGNLDKKINWVYIYVWFFVMMWCWIIKKYVKWSIVPRCIFILSWFFNSAAKKCFYATKPHIQKQLRQSRKKKYKYISIAHISIAQMTHFTLPVGVLGFGGSCSWLEVFLTVLSCGLWFIVILMLAPILDRKTDLSMKLSTKESKSSRSLGSEKSSKKRSTQDLMMLPIRKWIGLSFFLWNLSNNYSLFKNCHENS